MARTDYATMIKDARARGCSDEETYRALVHAFIKNALTQGRAWGLSDEEIIELLRNVFVERDPTLPLH